MALPVRPIFNNGQRLTAERLNDAVEYLRSTIRRLALAPLSAGVAIGLNLTPTYPDTSSTVALTPGIAIDGRGRLVVFENREVFSVTSIEAQLGRSLANNEILEVQLVLDDRTSSGEACAQSTNLEAVEGGRIQLVPVPTESMRTPPRLNCVNPWEDLDGGGGGSECAVVLGHIVFYGNGQFTATTEVRHGISAQLRAIRNVNGNEVLTFERGVNDCAGFVDMIRAFQPLVAEEKFVSNKGACLFGDSWCERLTGGDVQATHIAPPGNGMADQIAGMWPSDHRIFVVGGGAGGSSAPTQLGLHQGGMTAIQCRAHIDYVDLITRQGVPLAIGEDGSGVPVVQAYEGGSPLKLVGLSAAAAQWEKSKDGNNTFPVVPVCTSGLVAVTISPGGAIQAGDPLTVSMANPSQLCWSVGANIVARAAQAMDKKGGDILAWVVHMPQNLQELGE